MDIFTYEVRQIFVKRKTLRKEIKGILFITLNCVILFYFLGMPNAFGRLLLQLSVFYKKTPAGYKRKIYSFCGSFKIFYFVII